ncbi:MAG: tetratricopeptide repeat protein, partial [Candidatus Korobacteraceae bacterium]
MLSFPDPSPAAIDSPKQSATSDVQPSKTSPILLALLLAVATVALYAPVRHHPFVNYDDGTYVTRNNHVKAGLNRQSVEWAMTSYDAANWHPVTWLSHIVDYQLFKDNAGAHHDVNLLLHVVNVLVLFWVLCRATGDLGRSAMVAALFALHPINVESVAWIAERKNLLSLLFFLLTLGAWGWYVRKPHLPRYAVVMSLFALGLMSKPQVVTLPFVLLLWDYWPLERSSADPAESPIKRLLRLIEEKIPLFAMSAAGAIMTMKAQTSGGGFNPDYTLFQRLENAAFSYARYFGKAIWPSHLALMYPHPGTSLQTWQAGFALLILIAISILVVRFHGRRYLLVGWLWFLGTLVPMIGLIQVGRQAMADRYAYLPFVGLFIMVTWGVADFAQELHLPRAWLAVPACTALVALAALSYRQISYWSDDVTLWTHTLQVTTGNYAAENELADALDGLGRTEEAQKHFLRALAINPNYPPALMYLAVHDQRDGRLREAIAQYQQVIVITENPAYRNTPVRAAAFANAGHAFRVLGQIAQARDYLKQSVALDPDRFEPWLDYGIVSQQLGDVTAAIHAYYQSVNIHPTDVGYLLLAQALKEAAHPVEAKWAEQKAKDLTRDYP